MASEALCGRTPAYPSDLVALMPLLSGHQALAPLATLLAAAHVKLAISGPRWLVAVL